MAEARLHPRQRRRRIEPLLGRHAVRGAGRLRRRHHGGSRDFSWHCFVRRGCARRRRPGFSRYPSGYRKKHRRVFGKYGCDLIWIATQVKNNWRLCSVSRSDIASFVRLCGSQRRSTLCAEVPHSSLIALLSAATNDLLFLPHNASIHGHPQNRGNERGRNCQSSCSRPRHAGKNSRCRPSRRYRMKTRKPRRAIAATVCVSINAQDQLDYHARTAAGNFRDGGQPRALA
jgi:hypothetical protein